MKRFQMARKIIRNVNRQVKKLTLIIIQLPLTTIITNIPAPSNEPTAIVAVDSSSAV